MAVLTEEQSMLRDAAKSWVQEKSPVTAFRKMRDSGVELGYDAAAWNEMAEMGWAGVIIPEEYGGSDFGYLSLGLVLEETGRTLTASPLLASALGAASALILGGSDAQKSAWLSKIAEGTAIATLAIDEGPHHRPDKVATTVAGGKLSGKKTFVLEGMAAHVYVVSAVSGGAVELYLVAADAPGRDPQQAEPGRQPRRGQCQLRQRGRLGRRQADRRRGPAGKDPRPRPRRHLRRNAGRRRAGL